MGKVREFYNQNRYMIWIIILILVAIIVLIQILNSFISKRNDIEESNKQNTVIKSSNNNINENYSVITGQEVKKEVSQVIDDFVYCCNNNEPEKAYALLSDECKKALYPTLDDFTTKYYQKLFKGNITYLYQSWITYNNKYTYKIDFIEDMLSTGKASNTSITDYYTIVKQNEAYKLNINKFIGIENIDKSTTRNNIKITINRKRIYMDYETYEIEVENNSNGKIELDSLQKTNTVYIEDENGQKYYWYNHEILEEDISIRRAQRGNVEVKFNKSYQPKKETTKVVFTNVVANEHNVIRIEISL
mgnify:FL=1